MSVTKKAMNLWVIDVFYPYGPLENLHQLGFTTNMSKVRIDAVSSVQKISPFPSLFANKYEPL